MQNVPESISEWKLYLGEHTSRAKNPLEDFTVACYLQMHHYSFPPIKLIVWIEP